MRSLFEARAPQCALPRMPAERLKCDPLHGANVLRTEGLLRVDGLLSSSLTSRLASHSAGVLAESLTAIRNGTGRATELFAEHLLYGPQCGKRHDCKLPLDGVVLDALCAALLSLGELLTAVIGGEAELFELSTITSEPGTPEQVLHPDFPPYGDVEGTVAVIVFLALEDQVSGMGGTIFLPGTHTRDFHASHSFDEDGVKALEAFPRCAPLLKRGDAVVMDSALVHAGGANTLRNRPVFHFGFKQTYAYPGGRLSSMRESLRGVHSLKELIQRAQTIAAEESHERGTAADAENSRSARARDTPQPAALAGSNPSGSKDTIWSWLARSRTT